MFSLSVGATMKMSFFFYLKQKQESKLEEITACCFYRLQPESHSVCIYCSSYPTHHCDAWAKLEASRLLFVSKGEHRCVSVGHRVHTVSRSESINTRITSAWSSLTHWRSAVFEVNRVSRALRAELCHCTAEWNTSIRQVNNQSWQKSQPLYSLE